MNFIVPRAVFEQHIVLLGKTRSGKSSAMRVLVEDLLDRNEPVCVVDPKGDWWGLKSSASGKSAGYPVVIFGGEHADVPLNARSGSPVAELVATGNRSCIIDLGGWMPGERTQFWIDFASSYFRLHRGRHWLVIDEVHNFCPKGKIMDPNAGKMLHWSNRLASEGLGKGISMIAASQRPQKVHNDFLTSCETLIAMRVIHKADRDALKDWIDGCGDLEKGKELLNSVAQMKRGEGYVWSPEVGFGPKRLQFPMFNTFDSFKPSKAGTTRKLRGWADVDLGEVTKKLEAAVKEAEAKDPEKLKARIRELEKQVNKPLPVGNKPLPKTEIKVVDPRAIERAVKPLRTMLEETMRVLVKVTASGFDDAAIKPEEVQKALEETAKEIARLARVGLKRRAEEFDRVKRDANRVLAQMKKLLDAENVNVSVKVQHNEPFTVKTSEVKEIAKALNMTGPQGKIMKTLGELLSIGKENPPKTMVAAWAGYSVEGGAFGNPVSELKKMGLIEYQVQGHISLTEAGKTMARPCETPTREELHARFKAYLSGPEMKLLNALLEHGQEELAKEELASRTGYGVDGGAFGNPVSALRTKGLIDYPRKGFVKAADWLFDY
jgi:hypothetical protein